MEERHVGYEVHRLDQTFKRMMDNRLAAQGVDEMTMSHGWILRYLYLHREEVICQREIESFSALRRSTVTGILQQMEKRGLVVRREVEGDARLKQVALTEQGFETVLLIESVINKVNREIIADLPKDELDIFYRVLNQLTDRAKDMGRNTNDRNEEGGDNV